MYQILVTLRAKIEIGIATVVPAFSTLQFVWINRKRG
jgi:hypothetical protein